MIVKETIRKNYAIKIILKKGEKEILKDLVYKWHLKANFQ